MERTAAEKTGRRRKMDTRRQRSNKHKCRGSLDSRAYLNTIGYSIHYTQRDNTHLLRERVPRAMLFLLYTTIRYYYKIPLTLPALFFLLLLLVCGSSLLFWSWSCRDAAAAGCCRLLLLFFLLLPTRQHRTSHSLSLSLSLFLSLSSTKKKSSPRPFFFFLCPFE